MRKTCKKGLNRWLCFALTIALVFSMGSIPAFAETEYFPDNSIVEMDDELGVGDERFPDGSKSTYFDDDDLNAGEDEVVIPSGSASAYTGDDDDLGVSEDFPDGSLSQLENDDDLNAGELEESELEDGEYSDPSNFTDDEDELAASMPSISLSQNTVSVEQGSTATLTVSYSRCSTRVCIKYARANTSLCSISWGAWNGTSIPLSIKGENGGSGYVYIYLKRASDNVTLCSAKIYVSVTGTAYLSASTESLSLAKGSAKNVTLSYGGYRGNISIQYGTTNSTAYSCKWGTCINSSKTLTVSGKNVGNGSITVYLKDAVTGSVLASTTISVAVTSTAKLTLSASSVSLSPGTSGTVKVTYSNYSGTVYLQYGTTNTSAYSCEWGSWSGSTAPITVTGLSAGSGTVYVYLMDAKTNTTLAAASFKVSVIQNAKITASQSSVTVNTGASATVNFTVSNISGTCYIVYGTTNTTAYSCSWGEWSDPTIPLTITGNNAGTGSVTVYLKRASDDTTLASATVSITVKAAQNPKLEVSTDSVSVYAGNAVAIPVTYSNVSGSIYYAYSTTNTTAYTCSWGDWVDSTNTLTITGNSAGTGTVKVYLKRAADDEELASVTIKVTVESETSKIEQLSYKFDNFSCQAPLSVCQYMYGSNQFAQTIYDRKMGAGGNCYGMASTSSMFYIAGNGVNVSEYSNSKSLVSQLEKTDRSSSTGLTVQQFVQAMQISQAAGTMERNFLSVSRLGELISDVNSQVANGYPVVISIYGVCNGENAGHAVLAYGTEHVSSTHDRLLIYDSNHELTTRYLDIYKNSSGTYTSWSYEMWDGLTWGSGREYAYIAYTNFSTYQDMWNNHGYLTLPDSNLVIVNTDDYEIYDLYDNKIASVSDGVLYTDESSIELVQYCGLKQGADPIDYSMIYLPVDLYTIKNTDDGVDEFQVDMVNVDLGVQVKTSGDEVTICADDSCNFNSALLDLDEGESYSITLMSSREGDPANAEWTGISEGEVISASLDDGEVTTCNTDDTSMTIGDVNDGTEAITHEITVTAGEHGSIDSEKVDVVLHEDSRTYTITPDDGYEIDQVIVDGNDVGAAEQYTFENVVENHTIEATFKQKAEAVPSAPEIVSVYSTVQNSAKVTWKAVDGAAGYQVYRSTALDGTFTCIKTITDGKTVKYTNGGLTVGQTYYYKVRAFVTDSSGNRIYSDFSDVRYMPAAVVFTNVYSNLTTRIRLNWNEVSGAEGYQLWRADTANGTYKIVKTITSGSTTAYSNTGLEAGKVYYYKMRAYTTVNGSKVFGTYSDVFAVAALPKTPNLTVTSTSAGKAKLTWDTISGAAGYQIWRKDGNTGTYTLIKSITDGSTVSYTNSGLISGSTYSYRVRAYTEVNGKKTFGAYSTIVTVTVK